MGRTVTLRAPLRAVLKENKRDETEYARRLAAAFPAVDPGFKPYYSRVLFQVRSPVTVTEGGVHVPESAQDTEKWNTQTARVVELGPLAFHNRTTGEPWPEGNWCHPGDFVRVPKYGGDRWEVPVPGAPSGTVAVFVVFEDISIVGKVTGDPLAVKAFL